MSISRLSAAEHDSCLPLWRVTVDLDAAPRQVLHHLRASLTLSATFSRWKTLARPSEDSDLVEYAVTLPALDRTRYFQVIRYCAENICSLIAHLFSYA